VPPEPAARGRTLPTHRRDRSDDLSSDSSPGGHSTSGAIDIPASLTQIIRSELHPVPAGVHVAEVAETELVEILVFLIFRCVRVPVADIGAERIEQDIGLSDQGFHAGRPFIGIGLHIFKGALSEVDMSPAVGGELPAVVAETLRHLADRLPYRSHSWGS